MAEYAVELTAWPPLERGGRGSVRAAALVDDGLAARAQAGRPTDRLHQLFVGQAHHIQPHRIPVQ